MKNLILLSILMLILSFSCDSNHNTKVVTNANGDTDTIEVIIECPNCDANFALEDVVIKDIDPECYINGVHVCEIWIGNISDKSSSDWEVFHDVCGKWQIDDVVIMSKKSKGIPNIEPVKNKTLPKKVLPFKIDS